MHIYNIHMDILNEEMGTLKNANPKKADKQEPRI